MWYKNVEWENTLQDAHKLECRMQNKAIRNFVPEFRAEISNSSDVKWEMGQKTIKLELKFGLDKL